MRKRLRILVAGRVQGVGFRPTVFRYARQLQLAGSVCNTSQGVWIEVEGEEAGLTEFINHIKQSPPPQALIKSITSDEIKITGGTDFSINPSQASLSNSEQILEVPHDLALCPDCQFELFDQNNRRFEYPFINCTNCGPRFTLINKVPYDRPLTSMHAFTQCDKCQKEYDDPLDRRFDAQPNACAKCGPHLQLLDVDQKQIAGDPIEETIRRLKAGQIGAIKGIGGFHLCCRAVDDQAVARLRKRKNRPHKALAVMVASVEEACRYVNVELIDEKLLNDSAAPIVVLPRKSDCALSSLISPDTNDLGIMLAYAPLHHLLLNKTGPLVMTSGNRSEEPLVKDDAELHSILPAIADFALTHNRSIVRRCDDSVLNIALGKPLFIRRSRGYVPDSIPLALSGKSVLALGAELKNTFCLTRGSQAIMSQHIGDLTDYATYQFYQESIRDLCTFFKITPAVIAHDLHPDYLSTRHALKFGDIPCIGVQHHHAHIASCMAENGVTDPVIGIALDGTGFGPDGTVWGGEVLVADLQSYRRAAHFKQYPMPGGDEAVVNPWRMALSCLITETITDPEQYIIARYKNINRNEIAVVAQLLKKNINAPFTSSAGRLFDAVAAMLGLCGSTTYEGQAAIRLQQIADESINDRYDFEIISQAVDIISFGRMFHQIRSDMIENVMTSVIAGRFHNTVVAALVAQCVALREREALNCVALSGGVFQNTLLLTKLVRALRLLHFTVYHHTRVPPNDGGIALGQAVVALMTNRSCF